MSTLRAAQPPCWPRATNVNAPPKPLLRPYGPKMMLPTGPLHLSAAGNAVTIALGFVCFERVLGPVRAFRGLEKQRAHGRGSVKTLGRIFGGASHRRLHIRSSAIDCLLLQPERSEDGRNSVACEAYLLQRVTC